MSGHTLYVYNNTQARGPTKVQRLLSRAPALANNVYRTDKVALVCPGVASRGGPRDYTAAIASIPLIATLAVAALALLAMGGAAAYWKTQQNFLGPHMNADNGAIGDQGLKRAAVQVLRCNCRSCCVCVVVYVSYASSVLITSSHNILPDVRSSVNSICVLLATV
jgi:hypothetical protein